MSREALVLLVCCCDFRDGAERLIPSKSLRNAVIRAFPGLFCILRMCAPRRAAAVVRHRGREKSADRRRRILISRLLIIRASVPRRKSPFPAYFKGFPAVSPLIPPYPAFLKYPVSPHYEIDALLYIRYGDHGSDHIGVLTEILANLHTPLKDRVAVCRMVSGSYEMAQATGTDPDPNGTAPKMEILYQAQDAGTEAAMKSNDSYTVNPNNITG